VSKKRVVEKRKKERSRMLLYAGISGLVFVVVIGSLFFMWYTQIPAENVKWSIDDAGKLNFTGRGAIDGSADLLESNGNYTLEKVVYKSFGDDVYALLRKPANVASPPVVIVLPAATVTKEGNEAMARALCDMGYASLTLDERGNGGETGGYWVGNWSLGYNDFLAGDNPVQYKQIYDVIKGLDYVKSRQDLDGSNVALLGESMGGMWSIVAAGVEPQFKGVITISSCDFESVSGEGSKAEEFVNAVMPSRYLDSIPPRKLAMFQFDGDTFVSMDQGKALFDNASEPKAWHLYNGTTHGLFDNAYAADLQAELQGMLGR
jgi:dienelactone hydrolase